MDRRFLVAVLVSLLAAACLEQAAFAQVLFSTQEPPIPEPPRFFSGENGEPVFYDPVQRRDGADNLTEALDELAAGDDESVLDLYDSDFEDGLDASDDESILDLGDTDTLADTGQTEEVGPFVVEFMESFAERLSDHELRTAHFFECLLGIHHDEPETELEESAIGMQSVPERPRLVFEFNERFLGSGELSEGIQIRTCAIWRPSIWVFGQYRTGIAYFDPQRGGRSTVDWANRLDLFTQLNLTGTERVLFGIRPFDEERGFQRRFWGYEFHDGQPTDGWNADVQTLFFEGDIGEIFPCWDPMDTGAFDIGFSVGRMPLLAQQGLLLNEDALDAFTMTRNTGSGGGNLNLRATGVFSWNAINRHSPTLGRNDYDTSSNMVLLLTESDFFKSTVNLDFGYVYSNDQFGSQFAIGASAIRRYYLYHNTYNVSAHVLVSLPEGRRTPYADQGELLFLQTSWTPHHTEDLVYLNAFWGIDQFTSLSRGPLQGGPLGQTGIIFSAPGLGLAGPPIAVQTDNVAGASLGYQMFFCHTRQQIIWETGGFSETKGRNRGVIATTLRYQKAIGQHFVFLVDGFVGKQEGRNVSQGARTELVYRF